MLSSEKTRAPLMVLNLCAANGDGGVRVVRVVRVVQVVRVRV